MKAELFLWNDFHDHFYNQTPLGSGLSLDFLRCVNFGTMSGSYQSNNYSEMYTVSLSNNPCVGAKPYDLYYSSDNNRHVFFKITINGNTDNAEIFLTDDQISINLKSNNAVVLRGSSVINRLKPNLVWGYIEYKDSAFLINGKAFIDSLKSANIVKIKNLNPGDYYMFQIAADSSISHVGEQSNKTISGFTQPFLFEYNGANFNSVRSVAEKFVYELKDIQGIKIFVKDCSGNYRLIEYYL